MLEAAKETGQANLVEACDCYHGQLARAKERTDGKIATNFAQYKRLLDRKDIDAVVIATPDHWHLPMVLDALSAGKDVYIEKPMTHRIEDGPKMIEAARRNKRIVQVGSQWVSSDQHKKARGIVASGTLGKVTKVTASYNRNSSTGSWNYAIPLDLQEGVNFNWPEWLGPAPKVAFNPERVFRYRKLSQVLGLLGRYLNGPLRSPHHFHPLHHGRRNAKKRGRLWRNLVPARWPRSAGYARRAIRLRRFLRLHVLDVQQRHDGRSRHPIPRHGRLTLPSAGWRDDRTSGI